MVKDSGSSIETDSAYEEGFETGKRMKNVKR